MLICGRGGGGKRRLCDGLYVLTFSFFCALIIGKKYARIMPYTANDGRIKGETAARKAGSFLEKDKEK